MRIQYVSDIHLEFYNKLPDNLIKPEAEVLCLAGDIGFPCSNHNKLYIEFLLKVSKDFRKVFIITGNHEYYTTRRYSMEHVNDTIVKIIKENELHNVTFLDNDYEDFEGYRFVGATLWSKCDVPIVEHCINDFRTIKNMTPILYCELHEIAREFLLSPEVTESPLPVVVMTHHLPSYELIAPVYKKHKNLNKYFASDSDDLFAPTIKAWIYGHTHTGGITKLKDIIFACNPVGYPGENESINTGTTIEL